VSLIDPTLLHLVGKGFSSDAYAADGHHLRWSFDQRLGFPRTAFCVDRLASSVREDLGRRSGLFEVMPRTAQPARRQEWIGTQVSAAVAGGSMTTDRFGVQLPAAPGEPLVVDLHGGATPVTTGQAFCWVRLDLFVIPGGSVDADGVLHGWAQDAVVTSVHGGDDRRSWWEGLLDQARSAQLRARPDLAAALRSPGAVAADDELLRRAVATSDAALARRLDSAGLALVRAGLAERGVQPAELGQALVTPLPLTVTLVAPRIDVVLLHGAGAWLAAVQWLPVDALDRYDLWTSVGCFPILTDDEQYRADNKALLPTSTKKLADGLLTGATRPTGVEPLDEPAVPPGRAATDAELEARYLDPWLEQLEPWVREVLSTSAGCAVHQSEVHDVVELDEISTPGGGNVAGSVGANQTFDVPVYPMLLAASLSFQIARQLGLGCVLTDADDQPYDYRVRGSWRPEDLRAWPQALQRQVTALAQPVPDESPAALDQRLADLVDALSEQAMAQASVEALIATAAGDSVTVHGFAFDVQTAVRTPYEGAGPVTVTQLGAVAPPAAGDDLAGLAQLSWTLRSRAATPDDGAVPVVATIARTKAGSGEPFDAVLNAVNDFGATMGVVTVEDASNPGGTGTTSFWDRAVPANLELTYGVSECDPFGRWSTFSTADSRWTYVVPPPPPGVSATLHDGSLIAQVTWPPQGHAGLVGSATMSLRLHLRRDLPVPPSDPSFAAVVHDPGQWPFCGRTRSSTSPPFAFPAATNAPATFSHDGMTVRVEPGAGGFTVTFDGITMSPDAAGRTRVYVGATAVDASGAASTAVGGPGMGDYVEDAAPVVPVLQVNPDPLLATYPDALDRSTWTVTFPGTIGARYTLLRASEYDVVATARSAGASTAAYDSATTAADRAAAVMSLALLTRDAFAPGPVVDATSASVSLTDSLPGGLSTLTVYTVASRAANGSASPWPAQENCFAVVAVPQIPAPSTPVLVRGEWLPADPVSADVEQRVPHVDLMIAAPPPGTGSVVRYEVYRTVGPALAGNVRRMTPLHSIDIPTDTSQPPWADAEVAGGLTRVVHWRDAALADWTTYAYRVVARGPAATGSSGSGRAGTRSAASPVLTVSTLAAQAPSPSNVTAALVPLPEPTASTAFDVTLPDASLGPFRAAVRQVLADGRRVLVAQRALDPTTTTHTLDGAVLPVGSGQTVTLEVEIVDPTGRTGPVVGAETGPMP
jgi:hypothetical protein